VNNPNWAASGILIVDTDIVTIDSNYVEGCDVGISAVDFPSAYGHPWDYHILSNVIITGNYLIGNTWQIDISNDARNITVTYNGIINATGNGINVWSYFGDVYPTNVEIHYNNIEGSGGYGIWASEELEAAPVNATFNWWGDVTGPYHNTSWTYMGEPYGPNYGLGDQVSNYMLYYPWMPVMWHDVAVVEVVPSRDWVYQGYSVQINVTVLNKGDLNETVVVTLYYNVTAGEIIGIETINLQPGENATILFLWNTEDVPYCYNYTIATVATIPLDHDPTDNTLADGKVKVRIIGDVDGNDVVNMLDLFIISQAFGLTKEISQWNADVDINQDNVINLLDLYIALYTSDQYVPNFPFF